jgi:hypothetical protein
MTPIEFPEQTIVWAKNQPPYLPLPAYTDDTQTISCWSLTWGERLAVLFKGRLWLRQMNFGAALQPQSPSVETPFVQPVSADAVDPHDR